VLARKRAYQTRSPMENTDDGHITAAMKVKKINKEKERDNQ